MRMAEPILSRKIFEGEKQKGLQTKHCFVHDRECSAAGLLWGTGVESSGLVTSRE